MNMKMYQMTSLALSTYSDIVETPLDINSLIKEYQIKNIRGLKAYLSEMYKILNKYSDDVIKGMNYSTFKKYYFNLPCILSKRLFFMFNKSKSGYLNKKEFEEGMIKLFTEDYEYLSKFVFNFYDCDEDGKITPEDIRLIYSYFPLKQDKFSLLHKFSYEFPRLEEQLIAQEEIKKLIEWMFKKPEISFDIFFGYITKINIDPFIFLILNLYFYRPFTDEILNYYSEIMDLPINRVFSKNRHISSYKIGKYYEYSKDISSTLKSSLNFNRKKSIKKTVRLENGIKILTPLPNLNTIFLTGTLLESNKFFRNIYNNSKKKLKLREPSIELIPFHLQIIKSQIEKDKEEAKNDIYGMIKERDNDFQTPYFIDKIEAGQTKVISQVKEIEKEAISQVTLLSDTEGEIFKESKNGNLKQVFIKIRANYMFIYDNQKNGNNSNHNNNNIVNLNQRHKSVKILNLCYLKYEKNEEEEFNNEGNENNSNDIITNLDVNSINNNNSINNTITSTEKKVKKKSKNSNSLFSFELIFPKKSVTFFVKDQQKFNEFISSIKHIINYKEISDFEFKEKIGIGKFGIVRRGVHKSTKRKVAIKFINKIKMTNQDRILLSNEIDILTIIRHPSVINLYEIIDYYDICYIITEYIHGVDLYTYVEDKNYKIPEFRIVSIIQQLSCANYYLNYYGIIHRDIKPEHLLLDDKYEEPTIKLIDFGLAEILFPKEKTCAQFGTIGYAAPEVLRGIPYNKSADIWSIGILIYLLIIGCLPFDDANEVNKIKEMTINDEIPFPIVICKKKTQESIYLLENILRKDSTKRMGLEEILKSKWMQKFCKSKIVKERLKDKLNQNFYLYFFYEDSQLTNTEKKIVEQKKFLYYQK